MPQPNDSRTVLVLSNDSREISVLREILQKHFNVVSVGSPLEMMIALSTTPCGTLLCDWSFDGGNWREVMSLIKEGRPDLPVIVLLPSGGEYEWLEALDGGAFDLWAAPWHESTLIGSLEHAFASYDSRLLRNFQKRLGEDERELVSSL